MLGGAGNTTGELPSYITGANTFSPDSRLTIKALEMAWETRGKPAGVMFHSDSNNADVSLYHHLVCRLTRLV